MTKSKIVNFMVLFGIMLNLALSIAYLYNKEYRMFFTCFILFLHPLPVLLIERKCKKLIPDHFKIGYYILIFLSVILGNIFNLYDNIYLYDKFVHFNSGIIISWIGYKIYSKFIKNNKRLLYSIIIIFNVAIAAVWELIEFSLDNIFNSFLQKGIDDTMLDIVSAIYGGILFIIILNKRKH